MTAPADGAAIPPGFAVSQSRGRFTQHNGPVYRASAPGDLRSGVVILDRHCNGMGFVHGGMIAAFADGALAWAVWWATQRRSVTLKLTMSYLDAVREGEWMEALPKVTAIQSDMVHVEAHLSAGQARPVARADAVFRLLRASR